MTAPSAKPFLGLLLHLAGPLQSWGEHSRFNQRDTAPFPTKSGITGLLACALGRRRGETIEDLASMSLTIRSDRRGVLLRDLHTVGGGLPAKRTVTTAEGKKRPSSAATLLSHRYYLADAAFTAAITSDDHQLLQQCAAALKEPAWPLYLGRRSCPPHGPLLIGDGLFRNPLHHLVRLPLATASSSRHDDAAVEETAAIDFISDQPLDTLPGAPEAAGPHDGATPTGELNDHPLDFGPHQRTYRARAVYRRTLHLPATQRGGLGAAYLTQIHTYLNAYRDDLDQEADA
ncbi:type I-E CRISPR-associated protein Cas5/CasD [Streptomyces violaceusniger]|uniref:CRISPR-associated protein Cas5 family n=1 Tax=Streptomyces violaceusniger (strain Tu 4113) TaxID=653045 RepID=G2PH27_STRV4|nr:type I-E CRISPR-associated protein Cas5/CasD [Streptomyces violaceusniger]AEM88601.1 CRISPR-associated protein Cas5 family [Streptomyces violaceusniger Tu 4113]